MVSYGHMSGEPCAVPADAFVFRDLTLRGFWLVNWFRRTPEPQRRVLVDELAELITQGTLHAPIHATYDVTQIKEAVASAASGERSGKDSHRPTTVSARPRAGSPIARPKQPGRSRSRTQGSEPEAASVPQAETEAG